MDSKYGICCRVLMSIIARMVEKFEEPDSRIQLVFESGHKNGRAAEVILEEMYQIAPDLAKYINPTVSYALKKMSPGSRRLTCLRIRFFLLSGRFARLSVHTKTECRMIFQASNVRRFVCLFGRKPCKKLSLDNLQLRRSNAADFFGTESHREP